MPGKYSVNDSALDVSNFAMLPIDGWKWMTDLRGTSGDGKNKKLVLCLHIESEMSNVRKSGK